MPSPPPEPISRNAMPIGKTRNSLMTPTMIIRANPQGSGIVNHALEIPRPGISIRATSCTYSMAGWMTAARNSKPAAAANASRPCRGPGGALTISAVMRICSPRFSATVAPIMPSQRNTACARSSVQISGDRNA